MFQCLDRLLRCISLYARVLINVFNLSQFNFSCIRLCNWKFGDPSVGGFSIGISFDKAIKQFVYQAKLLQYMKGRKILRLIRCLKSGEAQKKVPIPRYITKRAKKFKLKFLRLILQFCIQRNTDCIGKMLIIPILSIFSYRLSLKLVPEKY